MNIRKNYWSNANIILRIPNTCDVDRIVSDFERLDYDSEAEWLADELHLPRSAEGCRTYWEKISKEGLQNDKCSLVISDHKGNLCGFINVFNASSRHGGFSYGVSILPEYRRKGFARAAVLMILDFYFNHLRYHRCGIHIYDFNIDSIRFHEKLGFVECGRLHESYFFKGKFHDTILFEMTAEQFDKRQ